MNTENMYRSSSLIEAFSFLCNLDANDIHCTSFTAKYLSSSIYNARRVDNSLMYIMNKFGISDRFTQIDLMGEEKLKFLLYDSGILSTNKEV